MNLCQAAQTSKARSFASLRTAVLAFNSPVDDGRATMVLLHLQHAFEMLLEAGLQQGRDGCQHR